MDDDRTPDELIENAEETIGNELKDAEDEMLLMDAVDPAKASSDPREGWFKIITPGLAQMFGTMISQEQVQVVPYIYGRLDGSEVAFDDQLSEPMLVVTDPLIGIVDPSKGAEVAVLAVKRLNPEHSDRCYIPLKVVMGMLPLDPKSESVTAFINATSSLGLTLPTAADVANVTRSAPGKVIGINGAPIKG